MNMINQTPTTTAPAPSVPLDSVMYRTLPFHVSMAAVRAQASGLVRADEFPPATDDWIADGIAMRAFLEERGAWQAYRAEIAASTFVADCPGWCGIRHAAVGSENGLGTIVHELPVTTVTLSSDVDVTLTVQGYQDAQDTEQVKPGLFLSSSPRDLDDVELTGKDAALLGAAFTKASDLLDHVEWLLSGGAE